MMRGIKKQAGILELYFELCKVYTVNIQWRWFFKKYYINSFSDFQSF